MQEAGGIRVLVGSRENVTNVAQVGRINEVHLPVCECEIAR